MAATGEDVRAITGSTLTDPQLAPFLAAALCILDRVAACTTSKGVSDECLDMAQGWLAAHLLGTTAVGKNIAVAKSERFENYSVERVVGGFSGKGVQSTPYGQTANALTGGCLAEADKSPMQVCFFG